MIDINQTEYEILKQIDERVKWIARDKIDSLMLALYEVKPYKGSDGFWWWSGSSNEDYLDDEGLFRFIKISDDEPYNIQKLIDEYEFQFRGDFY